MRYYGNQFGLTLYNKDDHNTTTHDDLEKAKIVTDEQLNTLRSLYDERDIDDEWVLSAIKAENYPHDSLEVMRNDWYELALNITTNYKLDEIQYNEYQKTIKATIEAMKKAATMNMLKSGFALAWESASKYKDNDNKKLATEVYETMKAKLEGR